MTIRAGGQAIVFHEANTQAAHDLMLAEAIALPLCFLLLVWFLRSAIAAAIPGAKLVTYPEGGHLPMEQLPDETVKDLRAFLASLPETKAR